MRQSTNRGGVAEPQVWFRTAHVAADGHHRALGDAVSEQPIEIALGPKGAFKNDNVGAVMRRVAGDRVISALPKPRGTLNQPMQSTTPRVVELLSRATEWQALIESRGVRNQAEIARQVGITRARVTQIMGLLRLAPEIQEEILAIPCACGRTAVTERALRPIVQLERPDQLPAFRQLVRGDAC
jgi:hypothetical protein